MAISPEIALLLTAIAVITADICIGKAGRKCCTAGAACKPEETASSTEISSIVMPFICMTGIAISWYFMYNLWNLHAVNGAKYFSNAIVVDKFGLIAGFVVTVAAFLTALSSTGYAKRMKIDFGEYYGLIMLASAGMMFLIKGNNLIMLFLGIELTSLSVYALTAISKHREESTEAAMKYFILGAFSSAILLFGMAFMYGATGSIEFGQMNAVPTNRFLYFIGIGMMLLGLAFKIGAVPFHMWAPDAYQAAPSAISSFMAVGVKTASFAALLRLLFTSLIHTSHMWYQVPWMLAVLTVLLGNLTAISQTNIKRMLAYSSIAHTGYILIGVTACMGVGYSTGLTAPMSSILFYLAVYALMNIGAFAITMHLGREDKDFDEISGYAGLAHKKPLLALAMAIFMFSLAGIPPMGGFMAKFYIFRSAIQNGYIWLAIIGIIGSIISVYYYLRIVVLMYMKPAQTEEQFESDQSQWGLHFTLFATAAGLLILGLLPGDFVQYAIVAVKELL